MQVEKQIRQYEQQLNEIKRRLESIEVLFISHVHSIKSASLFQPSFDSLSTKTDDNSVIRSSTFVEPATNRPGTVSTTRERRRNLCQRENMLRLICLNDILALSARIYLSSTLMAAVVTRNRILYLNLPFCK